MMDAIGPPDRETAHDYGAAAYQILAFLQQQLVTAGVGAVLESNFQRGVSEADLRPLLPKSRAVAISCATTVEESLRRFAQRARTGDRHPGHGDADPAKLAELARDLRAGSYAPLDLAIPTLVVDATAGYDPAQPAIKQWVIDQTGG
jgi:hypothetical protein